MVGNSKRELCAQCTQYSALFHSKGENRSSSSSSSATTFFKIMLGDDFSKILYLPPKFGRTVSDLVNEKIILVDSSGRRWNSRISAVGDSLALEEGWNKFSSDHGLEVGDFLVFNFVDESCLDVIIFDMSGCARYDFSKRKVKRKRSMDRSRSSDRDAVLNRQGQHGVVISDPDAPKMDSQNRDVDVGGTRNNIEKITEYDKSNGSAQSLYVEENCEGPCQVTSIDDLGVNGTGKITTRESKASHVDYGQGSHAHQNGETSCNKRSLFEGILDSGGNTSNSTEIKLSGKNNTHRDTDRSACKRISTLTLEENRKNNVIKSKGEVQECQFATDGSAYNKSSTLKPEENRKNNYVKPNQEVQESQFATDGSAYNKSSTLKPEENRKNNYVKPNWEVQECQFATDGSAYNKSSTLKPEENRKNNYVKPNREAQECQFAKGKESDQVVGSKKKRDIKDDNHSGETSIKHHYVTVGMTRNKTSFKSNFCAKGDIRKKIKPELVDMIANVRSSNNYLGETGMPKVNIKKEPDQSFDKIDRDDDDDIQTPTSISCLVPTDSDNFLELPTGLPYSCRRKEDRMVVYLRNPQDPNKNLWPVLYHERLLFTILAAGWSQFRSANSIRPGDVCTFGLEDKAKRIFTVDIVHN